MAGSRQRRTVQRMPAEKRVSDIMSAARAVLAERGAHESFISDVAERAGVVEGSLYRFFPSKEALANALLAQYAERALDRLSELAELAPAMTPAALADSLIDFMMKLQSERSFAIMQVTKDGPVLVQAGASTFAGNGY